MPLDEIKLTCGRPWPLGVLRMDSSVPLVSETMSPSSHCHCRESYPKFERNLPEKRDLSIQSIAISLNMAFSTINEPLIIRGSRFFITSLAFSAYLRYFMSAIASSCSLALNAASNCAHLLCSRPISACDAAKWSE